MKSRLYSYTPISQINITSLVDVTMVLLIVFILIIYRFNRNIFPSSLKQTTSCI